MIHRALGRLAAVLPFLFFVRPPAPPRFPGGFSIPAGARGPREKVVWEKYRTDEEVLVDETKGAAPVPLGETKTDDGGRFRVTLDKPEPRCPSGFCPERCRERFSRGRTTRPRT